MGSISNKVFNKIKKGQIKMRPKIYFILRAVLIALMTLLVALFVLFLVSFILFNLRASGAWFLPGFGFGAMGILVKSLPWLLIVIALTLVIILELLVKHFSFSYRRPILYSILGIIIFALLGSFAISRTHLHSDFFWKAQERKLPMMGGFYRGFGMPRLGDVHYGIISEIIDNGFYLETAEGEILTILATSTIHSPLGPGIKEGDRVVILGKRDDGVVQSFGVRKVDEQFEIFQRRPHMPVPWHK
ncbi:MAG: hypothetical protein D4S01_10000 [Dehalococcoidia bacterium]|nr:MAG: hypothetical protein D4S01_10000 [Dehalococcoidia bacterium]